MSTPERHALLRHDNTRHYTHDTQIYDSHSLMHTTYNLARFHHRLPPLEALGAVGRRGRDL